MAADPTIARAQHTPAAGDGSPIRHIAIDRIVPGPFQARRVFNDYGLEQLADSIRQSGVVQPVVLRSQEGGRYQLLAGERRWRAAQRAGLDRLPAIVRDDLPDDEAFVVGLIENLQRESLTPIEAAEGLRRLANSFGLTHEQLGKRIGKSREHVSNLLRLLQLDPSLHALLDDGRLSVGHAKPLLGLTAPQQRHLAAQSVASHWSVRRLESAVKAMRESPSPAPPTPTATHEGDRRRIEQRLADRLGLPVTLRSDDRGRGELVLRFHSWQELDTLLRRLDDSADDYTG